MELKIECFRDLIELCLLPPLTQDLDSVPLESEHFKSHHDILKRELPKLYDMVQQCEGELLVAEGSPDGQKVYGLLLALLCELSARNAVFKFNVENLTANAERLIKKLQDLPSDVENYMFTYYQEKLRKDVWKRQIGSVHGFLKYLEGRYIIGSSENYMTTQWINFCLSVALNVRECSEPEYKDLGVQIFLKILNHSRSTEIRELNIHSVIYEDVSKDVYNMEGITSTSGIWNCLCKCLDNYQDIDSLTWNQCDDMLDRLISNVTLAPNSLVSICLITFITKLGYYFTINRGELESKLANDIMQPELLSDCRSVCEANTSYTSFRWAKSILQMFVIESHKLMESKDICKKMLLEFHRCYLACILPIPLQVVQPHLIRFYEKFTAVLLESIALHDKDQQIFHMVRQFIETFYLQLQLSPYCDDNKELCKFRNAFNQLLRCNLIESE